MRLIHLTGPRDTDEAVLLLEDNEESAEEHCPEGWEVRSDTEIDTCVAADFPGDLPTGWVMKRGAY
jgi:hypothetical protein